MAIAGVMLRENNKGLVYPSPTNLYRLLAHHPDWGGVLRHNRLADCDEYHVPEGRNPLGLTGPHPARVTDDLIFQTRMYLDSVVTWVSQPGKDLVADAIAAVAQASSYHPVADYLAPLPRAWDGVERLDRWLVTYCGAEDTEYVRAVGARALIGACARVFQPGCKLDTMLVLVGEQGSLKSAVIDVLGNGWSMDTPIDVGSKDAYEAIQGTWLVEFAELAGMSGRDVEKLKAFFSSRQDTYRPPYARRAVVRPRGCAFFGTTNDSDFLKDATGSRRFHCVRVTGIDLEALRRDRDLLWGEAAQRQFEGAPWWLDGELARLAAEEAEAFTSVDPWEPIIERHITTLGLERVHTTSIYDWIEIPAKERHAGTAQRIVRIMCGRLGWVRPKEAFAIEGHRARGFRNPAHTATVLEMKPRTEARTEESDNAAPHQGNGAVPQERMVRAEESPYYFDTDER